MTTGTPGVALPPALRSRVDHAIADLGEASPELIARFDAAGLGPGLERVAAASDYALGIMRRWPELAAGLLDSGRLAAGSGVDGEFAVDPDRTKDAFMADLRRLRHREMLGIVWRDLCGLCDTWQTLAATSKLADCLIRAAADYAQATVRGAAELPPALILGMGKLGGGELNFSSDVDLVFLHPPERDDALRIYTRLARRVIELLDQRTDAGFVFRVDTRLRPFGASGALCVSLDAFDSYLQAHGREWERYAYIKARAITGREDHQRHLADLLRRFVYRRYLDFGLFESLRDMKRMIEEEVARRAVINNVKLGDGGIREVEFIVQALQIVRGGRQPELQTPSLKDAMAGLIRLGHLAPQAGEELDRAYDFLRRVENRLQMWRDQQTHTLPDDPDGRLRLAVAMGFEDWADCEARLETERRAVHRHFADLLGPAEADTAADDAPGYRLWNVLVEADEIEVALEAAGVAEPAAVADALARLRRAPSLAQLDSHGRRRFDRLMPTLLERAALVADGGTVFPRVVEILEGVGRRSAYFSLLNENPEALDNLVGLCRRSVNIARQVAANPLLLDSLIDPAIVELPTPAQRATQLRAEIEALDDGDLESLIETLAHFKHSALFEVSVADLSRFLPVMKVSDHITSTAETVLREILAVAREWLRERHGEPPPGEADEALFCVIGYGKLGGIELGYGSDLDLVFLYECADGDPMTAGPRQVPASVYFARLVQRMAHIAGAPTRFGALYEIDMRLRPSGRSGPLVSSLGAFERYQREQAWTWEHQALLRARAVAGDDVLAERFDQARREILLRPRDPEELVRDLNRMRTRLRDAHQDIPAGSFDLKHSAGALLDTEFLVQFWLLRHAPEFPALVEYSDHMRQLDALVEAGIVAGETCRQVQEIYLAYRTAAHRLALLGKHQRVGDDRFAAESRAICALWESYLPG